jgi:3D (Asp-Asp-Asp) domain-containing protein
MKNWFKTIYLRNDKGQYVGGISKLKLAAIVSLVVVIACGMTCSALYGPGLNQECTQRGLGQESCEVSSNEATEPLVWVPTGTQLSVEGNVIWDVSKADELKPAIDVGSDPQALYKLYEWEKKNLKSELNSWKEKAGKPTKVTAYTSRVQETDATPCISADGSDICKRYAEGERICATNDHPIGSMLFIQGLGNCIVRDRMNSRYTGTGRVDWYMGHDLASARKWGIRTVAVAKVK